MQNYPAISSRFHQEDFDVLHEFDLLYFSGTFKHNLVCGVPLIKYSQSLDEVATEYIQGHSFRYSRADGHPIFRKSVADSLKLAGFDNQSFVATAGGTGAILLSLMAIADHDSEIIVLDPDFAAYRHIINFLGANPIAVKFDGSLDDLSRRIEDAVTDKTRAIIFSNPSNPTGLLVNRSELGRMAKFCQSQKLWMIVDEAYSDFVHPGHVHISSLSFQAGNIICIKSLSKSAGLGGLRIGYAAGPERIISVMRDMQEYSFICPSVFSQFVGASVLDEPPQCLSGYIQSIEYARMKFNNYDIPHINPAASFFVCVKSPMTTGALFARFCYERGVAVLPGAFFSKHDDFVRLSFARELEENIVAIDAFAKIYCEARV